MESVILRTQTVATTADVEVLERALEAPTTKSVRRAIGEIATALSRTELMGPSRLRLEQRVASLARHPRWQVRRAVAVASRHFGPQAWADVLGLVADRSPTVRAAMAEVCADRESGSPLDDGADDDSISTLDALERRHGSALREDVERLMDAHAGRLIRQVDAQMDKVLGPVRLWLGDLGTERAARYAALGALRLARESTWAARECVARVRSQLVPMALRPAVEDAVQFVRLRSGRRSSLDVRVEVPDELVVPMHRIRLLRALEAVIENAHDSYSDELDRASLVEIASTAMGDVVELRIADRGRGLAPFRPDEVFRLFVTRRPDRVGVGLLLAWRILRLEHHGSITLEPREGGGTTARIRLPVAGAAKSHEKECA